MYTMKFYKNLSENNDIDKTLTDEKIVLGEPRGPVNILHPEILANGKEYGITYNTFNYCYIVELERYYYIDSFQFHPNGVVQMSMSVDVLMTYKEDIRASSGLILKQRVYNPYYGEFDTESRTDIETQEFTDPFDHQGQFVIVAMRG